MARKRAERQAAVGLVEESTPVQTPTPTPEKVVLYALCPVCGRSIPERRGTVRGKLGNIETQPYFDSIQWDPDKPFGIALPATGKGSFSGWRHISKEEAPELFEALKQRFLEALREWAAKGWIKPEDLKNLKL